MNLMYFHQYTQAVLFDSDVSLTGSVSSMVRSSAPQGSFVINPTQPPLVIFTKLC